MNDNVTHLSRVIEKMRAMADQSAPAEPDEYSRNLDRLRITNMMRARDERLNHSGVLPFLREKDGYSIKRELYKDNRLTKAVKKWITMEEPFLFIIGSNGVGKTLAAAIAIAEIGGLYFTAQDAERLFAAKFGEAINRQTKALETKLLVIDDVGTERDTISFKSVFYEVINSRQGQNRKTIITANLPKAQIEKTYFDSRITSRLESASMYVSHSGEDLRKK